MHRWRLELGREHAAKEEEGRRTIVDRKRGECFDKDRKEKNQKIRMREGGYSYLKGTYHNCF